MKRNRTKAYVLYSLLILVLLLTVAQRIPSEVWWIRISDFPHLQITIITLVLLAGVVFGIPGWNRFKRVIVILGVAGVIYQVYIIYPYTPLAEPQVEQTDNCQGISLSILEANVYQENREYERFIRVVRNYDPQIVIALETDQEWTDTLQSALGADYPHIMAAPLANTYGMILMSRIPFQNEKVRYLIEDDIPSFRLDLEKEGREVRMYVVHPRPPVMTESDSSLQRDAELVVVGREASESSLPVIVIGDLNDVAWSHTTRLFQRISGLLDPRKGRGLYNTFDANNWLLRYPLDHVFHSEDFLLKKLELTPETGSDHFPVFIDLCLTPIEGRHENEKPPPADAEDQEEGSEKVKKAVERSDD